MKIVFNKKVLKEGQIDMLASTKMGNITLDVRGMGGVPDQSNIEYMGFIIYMTPRQFIALNPDRGAPSEFLQNKFEEGGDISIAPPFLVANFIGDEQNVDEDDFWKVRGHEGRGRMIEMAKVAPAAQIPVYILPSGGYLRSRHITPQMALLPFESDGQAKRKWRYMPKTAILQGEKIGR